MPNGIINLIEEMLNFLASKINAFDNEETKALPMLKVIYAMRQIELYGEPAKCRFHDFLQEVNKLSQYFTEKEVK